jgi:hypothetical protein
VAPRQKHLETLALKGNSSGLASRSVADANCLPRAEQKRQLRICTILVWNPIIPEKKRESQFFFDHGGDPVYCECGNLLELF